MDGPFILKMGMTSEEAEKFQHFLMEKSGLIFEGRRLQEMERAVARRMIELGITSFAEYYHFLRRPGEGKSELNQLVLSLTVGETQFFRTPDQFAALRKYVLPELLERNRKARELRILSAGCATGEEPYTLLILLQELLPDFSSWRLTLRACDINLEFLEAARHGIYGERKLKLVDPRTREKYFERLGKNRWQVKESLRGRIEWIHFNLNAHDYFPLTRGEFFDLILCRNVLIYFSLKNLKAVIRRLRNALKEDGYLLLGYSETLFKIDDSFQSIHTPEAFFYRKSSGPAKPAHPLPPAPFPHPREEFLSALGSLPHPWSAKEKGSSGKPAAHIPIISPAKPHRPPSGGVPEKLRLSSSAKPSGGDFGPPAASLARGVSDGEEAEEGVSEDQLWDQAMQLFAEERFEDARKKFEAMLRLNPHSARGHLGLGFLYANLGVEDRSRRYAEAAKRFDDLMPELYFLLALLDEKIGEFDRAAANYQRVILLSPDFAMAHFNLGNLYLKMRHFRDARREFGNTITLLSRDPANRSLRFSGGLSAEAVISFCELQRKNLPRPASSGGGGR